MRPLKSRRRAWTVQEKIAALDHLHALGDNKKRAMRELGIPCAKMLREWLESEDLLREANAILSGTKRFSKQVKRCLTQQAQHDLSKSHHVDPKNKSRRLSRSCDEYHNTTCGLLFLEATAERYIQLTAAPGMPSSIRTPWTASDRKDCVSSSAVPMETTCSPSPKPPVEGTAANAGSIFSAGTGSVTFRNAVPPSSLKCMVESWLREDCPSLDYGGAVAGTDTVIAFLFAKSEGLLAGCVFFDAVFEFLGCSVTWEQSICDGKRIAPSSADSGRLKIATVEGSARLVLLGERVALNALAECSGIATAASQFVLVAQKANWPGRIAGTRKTTPGFRVVQKYGMMVGGMDTHRFDLSSMIMLKDNHIAAAGSIPVAVSQARSLGGFSLKIDVECRSLREAEEAASAGADVVMLDNFNPDDFRECARHIRKLYPNIIVEGSGGLTLDTIAEYFCAEADVLSLSINRYATPLDLSLKIQTSS